MATTNIHDIARRSAHRARRRPGGPVERPGLHRRHSSAIDPDLAWDDDGSVLPHLVATSCGADLAGAVDPLTGEVPVGARDGLAGTGGAHAGRPAPVPARRLVVPARRRGRHRRGSHGDDRAARDSRRAVRALARPTRSSLTAARALDVQSTGHADLVELADGTWAMVHLGTGPGARSRSWHTQRPRDLPRGRRLGGRLARRRRGPLRRRRARHGLRRPLRRAPTLHPRWIAPGVMPASFAVPGEGGVTLRRGASGRSLARWSRASAMRRGRLEPMRTVTSRCPSGSMTRIVRCIERVGDELVVARS